MTKTAASKIKDVEKTYDRSFEYFARLVPKFMVFRLTKPLRFPTLVACVEVQKTLMQQGLKKLELNYMALMQKYF